MNIHTFVILALAICGAIGNDAPVWDQLLPDQEYVVKDGPASYKLYYAGDDFASINLATSPDGLAWTPYCGNPIITDGQYHATVHYYETAFAGANLGSNASAGDMQYRIWYAGTTLYGIGNWMYGESPDGVVWYNRMPVSQVPGAPLVWGPACGVAYGIADVVYVPGAANAGTDWTFRVYANVQWEFGAHGGDELTIAGFSANGYEWLGYDPGSVGYATPVFTGTLDPADFDGLHVGWFKPVRRAAGDWVAIYSGGNDTTYSSLDGIGRAVSTDGFNWIRTGSLVTSSTGAPWHATSVWMPSVVVEDDGFIRVYFLGSDDPMTDGSWIWWNLGYVDVVVAPGDVTTGLIAILGDSVVSCQL